MIHRSLLVFFIMGIFTPSYAADITGYYQEIFIKKPFKHNQLCISFNQIGYYHVDLSTTYCPSEECMNARLDEVHFNAKLKKNILKYHTKNCRISIFISKGKAIIKQEMNGCGDGEQHWLFSDGSYELIRKNIKDEDCQH